MRRSIDNGLLPAVTQQDMEKRVEMNNIQRSLSHRRHSDVVEGSKSDTSSVSNPSNQSATASVGGARALSTPLPPGPSQPSGLAWDISSLLSNQTGNTGGTGQDTGLGSLVYSVTTSGTPSHTHSSSTALPADKGNYHHSSMSSDSRNRSSTQLNLSR